MKQGFLIIAICFVSASTVPASTTNVPQRIDRYLWNPSELKQFGITSGNRDQIITELRWHAASSAWDSHQSVAMVLLVRLGDIQTIQQLSSDFLTNSSSEDKWTGACRILKDSHDAAAIPALALALEASGQIDVANPTIPLSAKGLYAADAIFEIARRAPQFTDAFRAIAQTVTYENGRVATKAMQDWWQQNKEHFVKKDYSAVGPLPDPSKLAPTLPQKTVDHPQATASSSPRKPATPTVSTVSQYLPPTVTASSGSAAQVSPQPVSSIISQPEPPVAAAQSEPVNLPWEFVAAGVLIVAGIVALAVLFNKRQKAQFRKQ